MEAIKAADNIKEQKGEATGEEIARAAPALTPGFEKIKKAYEQTYQKQMTDDQINNLFKTAQLLEISENDGIWQLLLALENYHKIYIEAPWSIMAACKAIVKEMQTAAEAQTKKAIADTQCETARIARQNLKKTDTWKEKLVQAGFAVAILYSISISYVTFKLLAYKVVSNAGFSDFSNTLFKFLF